MHINFLMEEQDVSKLILSALIGATIGFEREYRGKPAGFKTMMMICLGSTLFTIFSIKLGNDSSHDRIAANIITGIGFIGAGAIFKDRENMVSGLTTATVIWIIAAIGMGVGSGEFLFSITTAALVLLLLVLVPLLEKTVDRNHNVRIISIGVAHTSTLQKVEEKMNTHQLKAQKVKRGKSNQMIVYTCNISGKASHLNKFVSELLDDSEILMVEL